MKKFSLLFLIVFLVSCNSDTNNEDFTWQEKKDVNNLPYNNTEMTNKQTQWLQNWDIVAIMKTTNGTIKIKLFTDLVPITTTNFIALSKKWYYNDIIFHRVIKDFMIQWGDPDGTGMWWTSIYWEKFEDEFSDKLSNIPYSISMANAGINTNGSQFFINEANNTFLDNKHSVFGQVVEWKENVDKIAKVKTWKNNKPEKEVKIISIDIMEYNNGTLKEYNFDLESKLKEIENIKIIKQEAKKSKTVDIGDTVWVHYTGTFDNWEKFDSSLDRWEPILFQVWAGQMILWFDAWVVWMKIWDKKTLKLTPNEAYWELEIVIPKDNLQSFVDAWITLEAWSELPTEQWNIKILKSDDISITIENTHPMAGKPLNFDIELVDIN